MTEAAVLVVSNDRYTAAFGRIWTACRERYWPDCPWPILFVVPGLEPLPDIGAPVLRLGHDEGWNRRALEGLLALRRDHNPSAVLLLHEDYLVGPQRAPGAFNADIRRCVQILETDRRVRSIGLIRKDPERRPYEGWPTMLGYHDLGGGIRPTDVGGINLWRTDELERELRAVIKEIPLVRDLGRNGAAEFSQLGALWAEQREDVHLRVRRPILYPDGILNILYGVSLTLGEVAVTNQHDLALVEAAAGRPLNEFPELRPYMTGSKLTL